MMQESPSQAQYRNAIATAMESPAIRLLLWRFVVEDCKVFESGFELNARAYALLAKQEIGKRLLEDMKNYSLELTHRAEQEYMDLMSLNAAFMEQQLQGESDQ